MPATPFRRTLLTQLYYHSIHENGRVKKNKQNYMPAQWRTAMDRKPSTCGARNALLMWHQIFWKVANSTGPSWSFLLFCLPFHASKDLSAADE